MKYGANIEAIDRFGETAMDSIAEKDSPNAKKITKLLNEAKLQKKR